MLSICYPGGFGFTCRLFPINFIDLAGTLSQENESKPKHTCGFVWFTFRARRFLISDLNWFDDSLHDSF